MAAARRELLKQMPVKLGGGKQTVRKRMLCRDPIYIIFMRNSFYYNRHKRMISTTQFTICARPGGMSRLKPTAVRVGCVKI